MADPLSTLGAIASAIKAADVAIRVSREIYKFLGELKSASDDVQRLRNELQETELLFGNVLTYMNEFSQDSAQQGTHENLNLLLPPSLTLAVDGFAEDIELIRKCLPANLSRVIGRAKFVFQKSRIEELTQRLVHRKATITLALAVIGRSHDLATRSSQSEALAQLRRMESSIAAHHDDVISRLETFPTLLAQHQQQQQLEQAALPPSPKPKITDDSDLLARVIRAELKQVFEPIADRAEKKLDAIVDSISCEVSRKAAIYSCSDSVAETSSEEEEGTFGPPSITLGHRLYPIDEEGDGSSCGLETVASDSTSFSNSSRSIQPASSSRFSQEVKLFSFSHDFRSKLGSLTIRVSKFRVRNTRSTPCGTSNHHQHEPPFYRTMVDFCPAAWLGSSRGISLMHSGRKNAHGYYDICPSVLTFQILSREHPVWNAIDCDDAAYFRQLLERGLVSLRDQTRDGQTILKQALLYRSTKLAIFILRDAGVDAARLLDYSGCSLRDLVDLCNWWRIDMDCAAAIENTSTCCSLLETLAGPLEDPIGEFVWADMYQWARMRRRSSPTDRQCLVYASTMQKHGVRLQPFSWLGQNSSFLSSNRPLGMERYHVWLLRLCLARGGDPDFRGPRPGERRLPLEIALQVVKTTNDFAYRRRMSSEEAAESIARVYDTSSESDEDLDEDSDDEDGDTKLEQNEDSMVCDNDDDKYLSRVGVRKGVPRLLVMLIRAGADVHGIVENPHGELLGTLTDWAMYLGAGSLWNSALESCGLIPEAVRRESDRRMENLRRLQGIKVSAVDVQSLEAPDLSCLRQRVGRQVEEE
ncbi:hypothetical protein B0H63DRAFT_538537 [Podospora didyma]|uniref:Fungal N-terminal domain-containing protein n=1 Tax=Podospora didyma TaxID=330526 RepID=A0AAE0NZ24_9PEZI|nr:hypothetical protein B0H63DRAFT_538537 [Podospora didyma]